MVSTGRRFLYLSYHLMAERKTSWDPTRATRSTALSATLWSLGQPLVDLDQLAFMVHEEETEGRRLASLTSEENPSMD